MSEAEIAEAIAEQEEHIRRVQSCRGVSGNLVVGSAHQWRRHGNPRTKAAFEACVLCGVTRTREDYAARKGVA